MNTNKVKVTPVPIKSERVAEWLAALRLVRRWLLVCFQLREGFQ